MNISALKHQFFSAFLQWLLSELNSESKVLTTETPNSDNSQPVSTVDPSQATVSNIKS